MTNAYDITTYGERMAEVYDQWPGLPQNTDAIVACLTRLAGGGPILELGIGTGRIALPLAQRGLQVHGIDASPGMVAQLRAKPGGKHIPVTIGNFADMAVEGRFRLIFVVFNTFFGLLSQDDQVRCFVGVAQHLADDGVFVLEAFVPDLLRYDRGQRVAATGVETNRICLEASVHDPVQQRVVVSACRALGAGHPSLPGPAAICLAIRAGPDGTTGRPQAPPSLGGVGPGTVHRH